MRLLTILVRYGTDQYADAEAQAAAIFDRQFPGVERDVLVVDNALPPEARALRWHLESVADKLRESELACATSRDWTRRLLGRLPTDE